jgi:hypothetical protein
MYVALVSNIDSKIICRYAGGEIMIVFLHAHEFCLPSAPTESVVMFLFFYMSHD